MALLNATSLRTIVGKSTMKFATVLTIILHDLQHPGLQVKSRVQISARVNFCCSKTTNPSGYEFTAGTFLNFFYEASYLENALKKTH